MEGVDRKRLLSGSSPVAHGFRGAEGAAVDPEEGEGAVDLQGGKAVHVPQVGVEAAPAELAVSASVVQDAVRHEGDELGTAVHDDGDVVPRYWDYHGGGCAASS